MIYETFAYKEAGIVLKKVESLVHKFFKKQRVMAEKANKSIDQNNRLISRDFNALPKSVQKDLMKSGLMAGIIKPEKGDHGHADH